MSDSHRRSITKAIGYKSASVVLLALLSWCFTRDIMQMTAITITYQVVAIVGYYAYERIWERISWGRYR